ncbi:MAG TPA: pyridoxamine 5'-phosphate oxidase family protein [Blastocatellia bacterium]|jgi:nitroimidazol reductase NimA-like FMN-containing flavoprotein (pyridoxamine 5'-phosphate oxidase superfamily)
MERFEQTERTTLKRLPKRGVFDREAVYRILDEAFICHVGFVVEGQPFVVPTGYGRRGDNLYIHGSAASRMLRSLAGGLEVCVTVTLLDGLVLARSAFHHSMNYRSVMIFGPASLVEDEEEKLEALLAISEQIIPGRWDEVRPPNPTELKQTKVLRLPLTEVSAKVRTGPPLDDEEDYALAIWAGEIPLRLVASEPVADSRLPADIPISRSAADYSSNGSRK